jgi:hypothetical protein
MFFRNSICTRYLRKRRLDRDLGPADTENQAAGLFFSHEIEVQHERSLRAPGAIEDRAGNQLLRRSAPAGVRSLHLLQRTNDAL